MPSQIIQLPSDTIDAILSHGWLPVGVTFRARDMELKEVRRGANGRSVRIHVDPAVYFPERHCRFVDDAYALLLTSSEPGSGPVAPPLLPDALVRHLIDTCGTALGELRQMTGHDRLAIEAGLEHARRSTAVVPGLRSRSPQNTYERALLDTARRLQETVAPALARLDRKLISYRKSFQANGVEAAIIRLGFQADFGSHLRLEEVGHKYRPRMSRTSRRGSLGDLMRVTHNQLAALQSMLEGIHAAEVEDVSWLRVETLTELHRTLLTGVPGQEHAGRLRTGEMRVRSPFDGHVSVLALPGDEVAQALQDFCVGFEGALWRDIHPALRGALGHVELARIHGFSDANGRLARLVLHGLLAEAGLPGLPLEATLYWNRGLYLDAVARAVRQGDVLAFVHFLLKAIDATIPAARLMAQLLRPEVRAIRNSFIEMRTSPRFAGTAAAFSASMLLGPDPQLVTRTLHGVEIAGFLSQSRCFQEVDTGTLGFRLTGYDSDTAYSSPAARCLLGGPLALL